MAEDILPAVYGVADLASEPSTAPLDRGPEEIEPFSVCASAAFRVYLGVGSDLRTTLFAGDDKLRGSHVVFGLKCPAAFAASDVHCDRKIAHGSTLH